MKKNNKSIFNSIRMNNKATSTDDLELQPIINFYYEIFLTETNKLLNSNKGLEEKIIFTNNISNMLKQINNDLVSFELIKIKNFLENIHKIY